MSVFGGGHGSRVSQVMSLSAGEFHKSVLALDARAATLSAVQYRLSVPPGAVTISYEPRPGVTLGGLLSLPRALVTVEYDGLAAEEQAQFQRRFDIAFQRGGG